MEGRVIANRYELLQKLGQGGMGSVWRARHLELGTLIAVKLIDPSLATHPEGLARFRREAQSAASLQSPNVVNVFDYGVDGDIPYIAMELLHGESLAQRLAYRNALPLDETAHILLQVARAIARAHEAGIVHRDLKPDNIFLVNDDDTLVAKVLDFGIAKRTELGNPMQAAVQTQTGAMLGTPYYMSPEQAAGKRDIDARADIWAFGVIAYECVTGKHAFEGDTLGGLILAICTGPMPVPSLKAALPEEFNAWCQRCVNRDRDLRYQTMREAASALAEVSRRTRNAAFPVEFGDSRNPSLANASRPGFNDSQDAFVVQGSTATSVDAVVRPSAGATGSRHGSRSRWIWLGSALAVLVLGIVALVLRRVPEAPVAEAAAPVPEVPSVRADASSDAPPNVAVSTAPLPAADESAVDAGTASAEPLQNQAVAAPQKPRAPNSTAHTPKHVTSPRAPSPAPVQGPKKKIDLAF